MPTSPTCSWTARRPLPVRPLGLRHEGQGHVQDPDGVETFEAGDAYYVGPGHTPIPFAGTEVVEFSPTVVLQQTLAVVGKNMETHA